MKAKSCVFDYDGTLTLEGSDNIYPPLISILKKLLKHTPLAISSGRSKSFIANQLSKFIKKGSDIERNLFVFLENGSIGCVYKDSKLHDFYRANWPTEVDKAKIKSVIDSLNLGEIEYNDEYEVVLMFRVFENGVYKKAADSYWQILSKLKAEFPDFLKYFNIASSKYSIGIGPNGFDKDFSIEMFANILRSRFKYKLSKDLKEIIALGDNPHKGGNDYSLLNSGKCTAFTVGSFEKNSDFYKKVKDRRGKILKNARATSFVVNKYLSNS